MDIVANLFRRDDVIAALQDQGGDGHPAKVSPVVRRKGDAREGLRNLRIGAAKAVGQFLAEFRPSEAMSEEILDRLAHDEDTDTGDIGRKRRQLTERRKRLRDLYELGDLDRSEYVSKRDALDAELDALAPGPAPDLDHARAVLEDFGRFWKEETDPEPRRELLQQLFELVWVDGQKIVAVRPTPAFADLFTSVAASRQRGVKSGSDGTRTRDLRRDRPAL